VSRLDNTNETKYLYTDREVGVDFAELQEMEELIG
jgi:hypothetical protein